MSTNQAQRRPSAFCVKSPPSVSPLILRPYATTRSHSIAGHSCSLCYIVTAAADVASTAITAAAAVTTAHNAA